MAEAEVARTDRVYIDESAADIYRQLKKEINSQPEDAPFETFKDIFMLAVCQGFQNGRRIRTTKQGSEIRLSVFSEDDLAILKAIAIAETKDVQVLTRIGEVLTIAEEYANGGIYEVRADLLDGRGRPLWNLVNLLNENTT